MNISTRKARNVREGDTITSGPVHGEVTRRTTDGHSITFHVHTGGGVTTPLTVHPDHELVVVPEPEPMDFEGFRRSLRAGARQVNRPRRLKVAVVLALVFLVASLTAANRGWL